jgi:hypothetical protein
MTTLKVNVTNTNTSKIPSDIPSFNINDLVFRLSHSNMMFRLSSLNLPYGLGIINLDIGREQSEKNNNNK